MPVVPGHAAVGVETAGALDGAGVPALSIVTHLSGGAISVSCAGF